MSETTLDNELENPVIDDTIAAEWKRIQGERSDEPAEVEAEVETLAEDAPKTKVRDNKGKFAKTDEAFTDETLEAEVTEEPIVEAKKAPSSWRKEAQDKFATLPPEIQDEVLKREQDFHKGTESYKEYAVKGQEYERTLTPYMATIQSLGANPQQAIQELFNSDHTLRYGSPQQKLGMMQRIVQDYGIDVQAFFNSYQNQPQLDPQVAALQQEISRLSTQQQTWQQSQQQQEQAALNNELASFAQGKEHFESVREDMAALLSAGRANTLQDAYDMAIYANPTTRALEFAKQQNKAREEAKSKANAAKQASSVNVQTRGVLAAQKPLGSIDDSIRDAARELGMI